MALTMELYATPASRLDSFVAQWLQPHRKQKEEVLEAVWTVQQFLREECFEGDCGLDQEVRAVKVLKVRLVPSIHRAGLGNRQHESPRPRGCWGPLAPLSFFFF